MGIKDSQDLTQDFNQSKIKIEKPQLTPPPNTWVMKVKGGNKLWDYSACHFENRSWQQA